MKCRKCGAELPEGAAACPDCGARAEKKKLSRGATIGISVALIVLVAAAFAVILVLHGKNAQKNGPAAPDTSATGETGRTDSDQQGSETPAQTGGDAAGGTSYTPAEGSYTVPESAVTQDMLSRVVAEWGDAKLTNEQLAYYYWQGIRGFLSTYAEIIGNFLDVSKPLDTQYYDKDGQTSWQAYFLEQAVSNFGYYSAMNEAAAAAGFTLPENYEAYLSTLGDTLAANVTQYGYADAESYLRAVFGPYATLEGYTEFNRTYLTAVTYAAAVQGSLSYTDDEIAAYYDENADSFTSAGVEKDDTKLVSVRHILIKPADTESDADWADAQEKAQEIYDTWKNNPTENYFAQLAGNYSEDTGSSANGGLYEGVTPGEMVEAFDSWCFDSARQPGDTEIVKTEFGYHIMYFAGYGEEYWRYSAKNALASRDWSALEGQLTGAHELVKHFDQVILVDPVGMYS